MLMKLIQSLTETEAGLTKRSL